MTDYEVSADVHTLLQSANRATMRTALSLGTAAVLNVGTGTDNVVQGNDPRLTDARSPSAHAAAHLTGSDQIPNATTSARGLMSPADKSKLEGIEAGANNYTLPVATTGTIGGVRRNTGTAGQFVSGIAANGALEYSTPTGGGDIVGPPSAVNNELALFDGPSGKLLKSAGFDGSALVQGTRKIEGAKSLTGGGDMLADRTIELVGDEATPANNRYYGTNAAGNRGYHPIPDPVIPTPKHSLTTDAGQYQLVNDAASPGNSKYYGTGPSGTKGFHNIPAAYVPTAAVSATTFSPGLSDAGKYVRLTNSSGCTITIFQQSTVDWQDDTEIYFRVATSGAIVVAEGSNVTVNNKDAAALLLEHDTFCLKRVASNEWDFI